MVGILFLLSATPAFAVLFKGFIMKKYAFILLMLFLWACGKEVSFKGKEYVYEAPNGFQITLGFDGHTDRYFGKGINKYYGRYTQTGNMISFGVPSSTMMMGDSFDMIEEEKFLNILTEIQSFELTEGALTLISKENKRFVLNHKKQSYKKEVNDEK